jgi:hypothetical protein
MATADAPEGRFCADTSYRGRIPGRNISGKWFGEYSGLHKQGRPQKLANQDGGDTDDQKAQRLACEPGA